MRMMSFALTMPQFRDGTKDVTRRLGWTFLRPGMRLRAVVRGMGLKRGEHPEPLGDIEVVSVRRETLGSIRPLDCRREGFGHLSPEQFVAMFCRHMRCTPATVVTRIEFRRID